MSADVGSVGQCFIALVLKTALSAGIFSVLDYCVG